MYLVWMITTVGLFIAFVETVNERRNYLEVEVNQKLREMIDLKEHMESLQKDIIQYISSLLNSIEFRKLNSMVQALAQEKVIRINFGKKFESMLEAYGQHLADLARTVDNIDIHIENRLRENTNATEVSFRSKIKETVSTIEEKCTRSMSQLNRTLGNLYEQFNQWRVPKPGK
ncbi:hypothetical protein ACJMK2_039277 [Sinanodonta woodiana]|uniref:Uncharacterized protein n=1 Tax=Sinanodonta woodiana TaxID=1069815 RepID=A0ABD3WFG2_SINWO